MIQPAYAELAVTTNYSFLRGASHPKEFVETAADYDYAAIGVADRNTLAGVVRGYAALQEIKGKKPKLLVGARLIFVDGTPDILTYPTDRAAYGRLCRLLSAGKLRAPKGECVLVLDDLLEWQEGQLLVVMPPHPSRMEVEPSPTKKFWNDDLARKEGGPGEVSLEKHVESVRAKTEEIQSLLEALTATSPDHVWLGVSMPHRGDDQRRLRKWQRVACAAGVPLIATNDVLYHAPSRRELQDVMTCIRKHVTLNEAGQLLEANAERHLKTPGEMVALFQQAPEAIAETIRFADRIKFSLDQIKYNYPD